MIIKKIQFLIKLMDITNYNIIQKYPINLTPVINIDIVTSDDIIRDIDVFYTQNGFIVKLDTNKISIRESKQLEDILNSDPNFKKDFDDYIKACKEDKMYGELSW